MADESDADDGAIHRIFQNVPIERVLAILLALRRLALVRGAPTDQQRAVAQALANDPNWSLAEHPVIQRILGAA